MNIEGKIKIANKWIDGQVDKNQFDFENKGKVGKGKLTWFDVDKTNDEDIFIATTKKFVCFGDNIGFIEANLGQQLQIKGRLRGKEFTNQEGKKVKFDEVVINEVMIAEKNISKHNQDKANGYQPQDENDMEIPF